MDWKKNPVRILALDLGTRTGWAFSDGKRIESGVQVFDLQRGESPGMRFIAFMRWLDKMFEMTAFGLCAFEQSHHRGGYATHLGENLVGRVEEFCAQMKIEHASVHSATLKKWITGKGNADKSALMIEANHRFPDRNVTDQDEADALCVLAWAMDKYDPEVGTKPAAPLAAYKGSC